LTISKKKTNKRSARGWKRKRIKGRPGVGNENEEKVGQGLEKGVNLGQEYLQMFNLNKIQVGQQTFFNLEEVNISDLKTIQIILFFFLSSFSIMSTTSATFSSSSGQMSGQWVNPKYNKHHCNNTRLVFILYK